MSDVANAEPSNDAASVVDYMSNEVETADLMSNEVEGVDSSDYAAAAADTVATAAADANAAMEPANVTVAVEHSYSEQLSVNVKTPPRSQISYTSNGHHLTSYASIVERGLEPECIIGTIKGDDDKPIFLIAWKNSPDGVIDFMESKVVNEKWPQLVIQFYQTRLTYHVQSPKIKTENNVGYYDEDEDEYNESNFNENPTI